jgi:hypothetical protein
MTLPPFTLVHDPAAKKRVPDLDREWMRRIRREGAGLASTLSALSPTLRRSVLFSASAVTNPAPGPSLARSSVRFLVPVLSDLGREAHVVTVGVWDIGAAVARLPDVIRAMNRAQSKMTFFEVHAAIPAGTVSRPARIAQWAKRLRKKMHRALTARDREEIADNVIDDDFFDRARIIRSDLGVDYLAGITASMVAGEDDNGPYWNFFTSSKDRCLLVSSYDLREFAALAGRPFEVAVGLLVLAQTLIELNPRLEYHEDRGCLFDENIDRAALALVIRQPEIDEECRGLLRPKFRDAALAVVDALVRYPARGGSGGRAKGRP